MIVATAGHVDHGKSALVEALTGREMDRAPEARRRRMTIDLGFAPVVLSGGAVVELIDVPGHEAFIRTMVAGSSGIDAVLLVVAADEGVMAQTLEHLSVLEHLAIPRGIPVVTKSDLVSADWLGMVVAELDERLKRSSMCFAPALAVSVRDGRGIADLRHALEEHAARSPERPADDLFRLPVDRVMSIAGVGTVVAGTCWSGSIEVGAEVRIGPGHATARVRSIQSQGVAAPSARPGRRIALGLTGIERREVRRGMTIVAGEADWPATHACDTTVTLAPDAPALGRRVRVRVHLGTDDVMGWLSPRGPLRPAEPGGTRMRLDRPIMARGGDRFVVRRPGGGTMAGGEVLDPYSERGRNWPPAVWSADPGDRLGALVERRPAGLAMSLAPVVSGLPLAACTREIRRLVSLERVGDRLVAASGLVAAADLLSAAVARFHRDQPMERGMPLETLRRVGRLEPAVAEAALVRLRTGGTLEVADGLVRAAGFRPSVGGGDAVVRDMVNRVATAGLAPPTVAELADLTRRPDAAAILRLAATSGTIEAVERDRYFARTALEAFIKAVAEEAEGGTVSIARLRERLGISRKYLIPLLEWSDRKGYTVRIGDTRRIRPGVGAAARSE